MTEPLRLGGLFRANLAKGKYSSWAAEISDERLRVLLSVVGEFGRLAADLAAATGSAVTPSFETRGVSVERMAKALDSLASVRAAGRLNGSMGSEWHKLFDDAEMAFSDEFSASLAASPETAWASQLDKRSLALLLWAIGEYGIRINTRTPSWQPPTFDGPVELTHPMRLALLLLSKLEAGEDVSEMDMQQVERSADDWAGDADDSDVSQLFQNMGAKVKLSEQGNGEKSLPVVKRDNILCKFSDEGDFIWNGREWEKVTGPNEELSRSLFFGTLMPDPTGEPSEGFPDGKPKDSE